MPANRRKQVPVLLGVMQGTRERIQKAEQHAQQAVIHFPVSDRCTLQELLEEFEHLTKLRMFTLNAFCYSGTRLWVIERGRHGRSAAGQRLSGSHIRNFRY